MTRSGAFRFTMIESCSSSSCWTLFRQDPERERLLADSGIVRNRMKIDATIGNAREFLRLQKEHGSFDSWIWQFTEGRTLENSWASLEEIPALTDASDAMSKALKAEGFKFVGSAGLP